MRRLFAFAFCLAVANAYPTFSQSITEEFDSVYSLLDLGSAQDVPANYGGLFILPDQPNTLYLAGSANSASGALYAVPIARDAEGFISGFAGPGVRVADAPNNDGGIVPDPGGLISFARWPTNAYGQIDLSTGTMVNSIDLAPFGVASSSSSVNFIPDGYPGAGGMRIASYGGGQYYQIDYSVGEGGIITILGATHVPSSQLPGGPEGFAYVPLASPLFDGPSIIVSEYSGNLISTYEMNEDGDPIISSRRILVSGLTNAEGAAIDPISGSFLFSTFGAGNRVIVVNGFVIPEPSSALLLGFGAAMLTFRRRIC